MSHIDEEMAALVLEGNSIAAMKAYRSKYNMPLKRAKEEIELFISEMVALSGASDYQHMLRLRRMEGKG